MPLRSLTAVAAAALTLFSSFGAGAADTSPMTITPSAAASAAASGNASSQARAAAPANDKATDAKGKEGDKLGRSDRNFAEKAAQGSLMEVELGKLAQQKAAAASVKSFGSKMVEDHGKASAELMTLASTLGLTLPQQPDKSHQKEIDKLAKLEGAEFDKRYMKMMVSDHKKDVSDFEKAAKSLKHPELKNFAAKTLPTLKDHLKLAQTTEAEVRKTKSPG